MLKITKKYNFLIVIVISFIFILCEMITLQTFNMNQRITTKYILVFILAISIAYIKRFRKVENSIAEKKRIKLISLLWITFSITIIGSKIINNENEILDIIIFGMVIPIFFFKNNAYDTYRYIGIGTIIASTLLLIFIKPNNSMGIMIAFIGVIFINHIWDYLIEKNNIFLYTIVIEIFLFLIYLTKSRTSLIAFGMVTLVNYVCFFWKNRKNKKMIFSIILLITIMIILVPQISNILNQFIFNKYVNSEKDMTSGRSKIWDTIVTKGLSIWGNEEDKYIELIGIGDAHNIFFQMLGHYGIINTILFIIINFYIIYRCIKTKNIKFYNFFLLYYAIGMFENILISDTRNMLCNILFFYHVGIMLRDESRKKEGLIKQ